MTAFARDLPFGATLVAPDRTRFRLHAPSRRALSVEIEGRDPVPFHSVGDGWYEAEAPVGAGARYRYRLDGGLVVPDPAARAQAGGVYDPSLVVDPGAYRWRTAGWRGRPWQEAVIIEVHAGLCGGFDGVAARLPEWAALGFSAIELMPVAAFPGRRNWGYDGVLPFAPAAAYGPPAALKALVDRAHALGLMMLLDVVYNHFGPDGNFLPEYWASMFRTDIATPWSAAVDLREDRVLAFFTENALYWLDEYRFDGLRLDAVHAIPDQDRLDLLASAVRAALRDRHIHLVVENEDNVASRLRNGFTAQWNDDVHHALHVLLTGEQFGYYRDYADDPARHLARGLAEGFIYQGEPSAHRGGRARGTPGADLPPTAFVNFLQNHDQTGNRPQGERLTVLADPAALRAATGLVLLCPATPLVFMGEETGSTSPFCYFTDHTPDLAAAVREGRRREFAAYPGFDDATARERIPDPNDPDTYRRSAPEPGPAAAAWRDLYRDLLTLRRERLVPHLPGTRSLGAEAIGRAAILARWRLGNGSTLVLAANLGPEPASSRDLPRVPPDRAIGAGPSGGAMPGNSFAAWFDAS